MVASTVLTCMASVQADLRKSGGPGAGIIDLRAEHEIGFAVNDKGKAAVFAGNARVFLSEESCGEKDE